MLEQGWLRIALSVRGSKYLGASVERKLVERLFSEQKLAAIGCLDVLVEATLLYYRTGQLWIVAWGAISIAFMLLSLRFEGAFRRRDPGRFVPWLWCFLGAACVNGLLCGIGGAAASGEVDDAFAQLLLVSTWTAFVMGAAARLAALPIAVFAYLGLAELPMVVNLVSHPDLAHLYYVPLTLVFVSSGLTLAREIYRQAVDFLRVDEERATLVARVESANERLSAANERLAAMAMIDELTGIANRRLFDETLAVTMLTAARDGCAVSVVMLDIDWFKLYNDRYGHQAGDECLRRVAHALGTSLVRPADLLARYGGEEFVALLPETDASGVAAVGDTLRAAVCALAIETETSAARIVTISVGGATWLPGTGESGAGLVGRADAALYEAKRRGRNRFEFAARVGVALRGRGAGTLRSPLPQPAR